MLGVTMAMKARNLPVLGPRGFLSLSYWEWEGPPGAPAVLCVHGLTRNGRDFDFLAEALSSRFRVVCPDMPGRGRSDWLEEAESYIFPFYLSVLGTLRDPSCQVRRSSSSVMRLLALFAVELKAGIADSGVVEPPLDHLQRGHLLGDKQHGLCLTSMSCDPTSGMRV